MAYEVLNPHGIHYFLNAKEVMLNNGHRSRIYYFSRDEREDTGLDAIPDDREVVFAKRSGMPVLRKKR